MTRWLFQILPSTREEMSVQYAGAGRVMTCVIQFA